MKVVPLGCSPGDRLSEKPATLSFVKLSLPVDADASKQSSGHDLE